ncbi:synaptotagmin-12 isoform X1 [Dryobates pubescens]|uniref:synaptotagmin-12 isoform X1 n=2 Tax=Dryobates pubescens TaxID=118200 RepID=UPI0023B9CDDC|nr:synaptotagmin-12 isoform X1 [Dryobates pubescens]
MEKRQRAPRSSPRLLALRLRCFSAHSLGPWERSRGWECAGRAAACQPRWESRSSRFSLSLSPHLLFPHAGRAPAGAFAMDSSHGGRDLSVTRSPPQWEIGIYVAGALVLLGVAAANLWKLWRSGSYPAPSPFPNYDYRYLQQKYGAAYSDVKHKRGLAPGSQRAPDRSSGSRKHSLQAEDTFESIAELGSLELMSRDLAHYGPLKKSISADSLNSISSIGNNFGQDFTVGQVEVSMEYDSRAATLHVRLLQGKDLLEKEEVRFESCFVRLSLLPAEQLVGISRIQRSAYAVAFDERFSVPLPPAALEEHSLRFSAFGIDEDERKVSAGVAELKLSDLDLATRPFNAWLYLQDVNKAVDTVGEILLSLSYLPTAERLTVVVVKAKNLVWSNGKVTADPFVKVYLLQDGRKISKKKTAVKRDDPNPVFNEAMIFSVPAIVLQELSLRVTVAECGGDGRAEHTGHVLIGPAAGGMGITHWNQMLATLRKPVSMWHPLRRN